MNKGIYIYIYIFTLAHIHTHTPLSLYIYMHIYICIYVYVYVYVYVYMYVYANKPTCVLVVFWGLRNLGFRASSNQASGKSVKFSCKPKLYKL